MIRNRLGRPARSLMVAAAVVCWIPCVPAAAAGALPVQDNTVPGAPTNLEATALTTTTIYLLWDPPSSDGGSDITGYQIEASANSSTGWIPIPNTGVTNSFTHSGRKPNTTLYYHVAAINDEGQGNFSTSVAGITTPGSTGTAGAPGSLTATAAGPTTINLAWGPASSDGVNTITGYQVAVSANVGVSFTPLATTGPTQYQYSHSGLPVDATRHYRVRAVYSNGTYGPPAFADATTAGTGFPGAPQNLSATAAGPSVINLEWDTPASNGGERNHRLPDPRVREWRQLEPDRDNGPQREGVQRPDRRSGRYPPLPGQSGERQRSGSPGIRERHHGGQRNPRAAPRPDGDRLRLVGDRPRLGRAGRRRERAGHGLRDRVGHRRHLGCPRTQPPRYRYRDDGLSPGTTWHYRVAAVNQYGQGDWSDEASATTSSLPGRPTSLTARAVRGTSSIELDWTAPSGGVPVTGYRIEWSETGTSRWTRLPTSSRATSYTHTGLSPGTTRHYRVAAINTAGLGPWSSVVGRPSQSPFRARPRASGRCRTACREAPSSASPGRARPRTAGARSPATGSRCLSTASRVGPPS